LFGKNAKKKYESDLAAQQSQSNQLLSQYLNKPPSALEQGKEKEQTDWLTETNSPDFDITKVGGMSPYLDLFNRAKANDLSDETPLPAAASWGGTPNASLSEALKAQGARSREQEAAGGLQAGYAAKNASIRGETLPFLGMQQDKNMGLINALNGRSLGLYGLYGNSISQPSFFQRWLLAAAAGSHDMAAAGAGGG
jgi:hypothetical protein